MALIVVAPVFAFLGRMNECIRAPGQFQAKNARCCIGGDVTHKILWSCRISDFRSMGSKLTEKAR